jgi:two-component system phosphate regulon sensor histidine kinase PhoR
VIGTSHRAYPRSLARRNELPRWFGLSVVIIYLAGLFSVAWISMSEAQREPTAQIVRQTEFALRVLARDLGESREGDSAGNRREGAQLALRNFAQFHPVTVLRIVEADRRVSASSRPEEAGTRAADPFAPDSVERNREGGVTEPAVQGRWTRIPLRSGESVSGAGEAVLEARIEAESGDTLALLRQTRTLVAVGVVFAALLVVYRFLRRQLRGVFRVVDRLATHRHRIESDLASLRISDSLDTITASWNELISSAQGWLEAVQRTAANEELARVLQKSSGGTLAEALHALPDAIVLINQEVRVEYLNSAACRLFGWKSEEARRQTLAEAKSGSAGAPILEKIRQALTSEGCFEARSELVEVKEDGGREASSFRVQIVPLDRTRREGACLVHVRDVSQQVRADRAREEFVTQVTHELRTPLTNIRAYAETLASGLFDDPKVITDCYNVITRETRRLSRLIEDILSVSQLEVGSIELAIDNVDLRALLSDGVRDIRGLADEKNIDIQLSLPAKMEPIRGDRDKLAVVLNNLLGNAIKYTPKEGNVVVGCQFTGQAAVITMKDNGIGIDAADHARIFEKFQRANDPAVQAETGTGIGLYTAREIVRRHGGDIAGEQSDDGESETGVTRWHEF